MKLDIQKLFAAGLLSSSLHAAPVQASKTRTVITTDMESDDLASMLRYLLYSNEFDTEGIIYSSARFHWAGDGKGTKFFLPDREYDTPQTSWRWTGTRTIQDKILKGYEAVYGNLRQHAEGYPAPEDLLPKVKIGNIVFEGEIESDTDGSNLIRDLLLDDDPRVLYLQAWGGTSTIARALKSIEETHGCSRDWPTLKDRMSSRAVLLASGFQDNTYEQYIRPHWPDLRVHNLSGAYATWSFHCARDDMWGLPEDQIYWSGEWTEANIQKGPLGSLYRSWLDGQRMEGDHLDIFGDPEKAPSGWCKPLEQYDFLSEGDNVVFNALLDTGLQNLEDPTLGSWGGRLEQNETVPSLWGIVGSERLLNGTDLDSYSTHRWIEPAQNDFAARMKWTLTPEYSEANHPPSVKVVGQKRVKASPGSAMTLRSKTSDPDGDKVAVSWWQYLEEGTYPGTVTIDNSDRGEAKVYIPDDAEVGQTLSIILQGTDDGEHPTTRYDRVFVEVS